jgi:hypothetical protein
MRIRGRFRSETARKAYSSLTPRAGQHLADSFQAAQHYRIGLTRDTEGVDFFIRDATKFDAGPTISDAIG